MPRRLFESILKDLTPHERFYFDGGEKLLFDFSTQSLSKVIVVGGYLGESARKWSELARRVDVFEPVESFFLKLETNLRFNENVFLHRSGLGSRDSVEQISISNDSSSQFIFSGQDLETIQIKDVASVVDKLGKVSLMEINAEGAEYEILRRLISVNLVQNVRIIQVQFHRLDDNSESEKDDITRLLEETHDRVWSYSWVWERWTLKPALDPIWN